MTPTERLLRGDDADFFAKADLDVFTESLLEVAAQNGRLLCCKVIYEKYPHFLYQTKNDNVSLLQTAAYYGKDKVVEFLLYAKDRASRAQGTGEQEYIESGRTEEKIADSRLLMMVNKWKNTALHDAAGQGHVQSAKLLVEADTSNLLLKMVNEDENTALHIAVANSNLEMVILLVARDLNFSYYPNKVGLTPHLIALDKAITGAPATVQIRKHLIEMLPNQCLQPVAENGGTLLHHATFKGALDAISEILLYCPSCIYSVNAHKNTALHDAVGKGHLQSAKLLVEASTSNLLSKMVNEDGDTALHIAVRHSNLEMVILLVARDLELDYSANKDWRTPHIIAVDEATKRGPATEQIRKYLIQNRPNQCQVPVAGNGGTLLHHAANIGDLDAIKEIAEYSPICISLQDYGGQNFIHIAAKRGHEHVVAYIMRSMNLSKEILNQQDMDGNTPLHLATLNRNADLTRHLLYDSRVDVRIKNHLQQTPLAAITFEYDKRRALLGFTVDEKELKNRSDFDLFVGALICAVSFTAGIAVPGGFIQDKGTAILYKKPSFQLFMISNAISFVLSLYAVFSHFSVRHLKKEEYVNCQLKLATFSSFGAIFAVMVAFISGSFAVLQVSLKVSITICAICSVFFFVASYPIVKMVGQQPLMQSLCTPSIPDGNGSENQCVPPTASSQVDRSKNQCVPPTASSHGEIQQMAYV